MVEVDPKQYERSLPTDHGLLITDYLFAQHDKTGETASVVHRTRS